MELKQAILEYKNFILINENKSMRTVTSYMHDLEAYIQYLKKSEIENTSQVSFLVITAYLNILDKQYSARSIQRISSSIRSFHRFLNFKYEQPDPSRYLQSKKPIKTLPVYCTIQEIELLMQQFGDSNDDILYHAIDRKSVV